MRKNPSETRSEEEVGRESTQTPEAAPVPFCGRPGKQKGHRRFPVLVGAWCPGAQAQESAGAS
eukprot:4663744-Pyramimonas_sp.AAC.1